MYFWLWHGLICYVSVVCAVVVLFRALRISGCGTVCLRLFFCNVMCACRLCCISLSVVSVVCGLGGDCF